MITLQANRLISQHITHAFCDNLGSELAVGSHTSNEINSNDTSYLLGPSGNQVAVFAPLDQICTTATLSRKKGCCR